MADEPKVDNDSVTNDDVLNKHIDMAIEAQDGKIDTTETTNTENQQQEKPEDTGEQGNVAEAGNSGDKNKDAQQQTDKKGTKDKSNNSDPKDLKLADGTVVKGGAERRFYEQLQTARQQVNHITERATRAEQQLQVAQQNMQALQQAVQAAQGMPAEELAVASRMYGDMKRDPVGTLQKLLAEAVAAGYKIEGIASGVDARAIERILENRSQMQTSEPSDEQVIQEAEVEWSQFISKFPDALPHDALLASMLRDNPTVGLTDAYFNLKSAFAERGLDWNRPLSEQQPAQADVSTQQQQQEQKKPLPNGRPAQNDMGSNDKVPVASEHTDIGDIIKESMREAGMNIN